MTYPYQQFENTGTWRVVDDAINALVQNGDLKESTARRYIVGYICEQLDKAKVLRDATA